MASYFTHGMNAFLLTVILTNWLRTFVVRFDLVDRPSARKLHEGAVPICGGIAMFIAFLIANAGIEFGAGIPSGALVGLALIAAVGIADDRWDLPALPRLLVQLLAAAILVEFGSHAAINLAAAFPPALAPVLVAIAPTVAILFIVGSINAVNMIDGVDGLAGGVLAMTFFWLALLGQHLGDRDVALEALVLMCAVLGFLFFNLRHPWRSRAAVYMGDAGSMMLGAAAAYFIVTLSSGPEHVSFPLLLWVIVVPLTDTLVLMVRRIAAGRSPMSADRWHLHHLILDRGLPPAVTTAVIIAISATCGGVAYAGLVLALPDYLMLIGLFGPVALHVAFVVASTRTRAAKRPAVAPLLRTTGAALEPRGQGRS
ncbi:MAG: Phospho-N-acetylmuramoyl-pentapeptide-transferase [Hyphomicrobiales bacterium]|nr:Phospho-N-acetylmuramoyl-pentapeptide-transferase [Hyphomicrobiales bacterium]